MLFRSSANPDNGVNTKCELSVDIAELPMQATPSASPIGLPTGRPLEVAFLLALLLTWLVEVPVVWLLARYAIKLRQVTNAQIIVASLLATTLTLPYLWFVATPLLPAGMALWLGEAFVFAVELLLYRWLLRCSWPQAALLSLAANALSLLVGLVVQ